MAAMEAAVLWAAASLRRMNSDGVPHADSYATLRDAGLSVREIVRARRIVATEAALPESPVLRVEPPTEPDEPLELRPGVEVREELLDVAASESSREQLLRLSPEQQPQLLAAWGLNETEAREALRRMDVAAKFLRSLRSRL